MQTIRLYDPERRPPNWTQIIHPGQYAAFSQHVDSEASCDAAGTPFASPDAVTCLIFDSLLEATAFCKDRVEQTPAVRFDIFDSTGRAQPPLLTIVHPSHAASLEGNRRATRLSNWGAAALLVAGPLLLWFDWAKHEGLLILPTILGINCLFIAGRLLQLNGAHASAEKDRRQRLAQHIDRGAR
jgi:hypothetical protein